MDSQNQNQKDQPKEHKEKEIFHDPDTGEVISKRLDKKL